MKVLSTSFICMGGVLFYFVFINVNISIVVELAKLSFSTEGRLEEQVSLTRALFFITRVLLCFVITSQMNVSEMYNTSTYDQLV